MLALFFWMNEKHTQYTIIQGFLFLYCFCLSRISKHEAWKREIHIYVETQTLCGIDWHAFVWAHERLFEGWGGGKLSYLLSQD